MSKDKGWAKVLVTMPVFNNLVYTKKALATLELSERFFLYLVDNGSSDGTEEFFKARAKTPNVFSWILEMNLGAAGSWNAAIQFAFQALKCEEIIILNNDILLLPRTLDLMLETLKAKDVGLVSAKDVAGKVADEDEFLKLSPPKKGLLTETPDFSCFAIKRECIEKVGLFDEVFYPAYFEDNDYHYRMRLEGLRALCDHRAIYYHFGSRTKLVDEDFAAFLDKCYLKNREYFEKKWGGGPGKEKYKIPFAGKPPKKIEIQEMWRK